MLRIHAQGESFSNDRYSNSTGIQSIKGGELLVKLTCLYRVYMTLWRACNLTSFSPCLTGPVDYLFAFRHKGPRFKSPGGYLCETGILLLAMSRYIGDPDVIDHHGLV
jgi:hypothetical protein